MKIFQKPKSKTTIPDGFCLATFRIEKDKWSKFQDKYKNSSQEIRNFITESIGESNNSVPKIKRGDWNTLLDNLIRSPSLIIYGKVGSGKTTLVKDLIKNDSIHKYLVIDSHNEYDFLPIIYALSNVKENTRVGIHTNPEIAKSLFASYYNQILSQSWDKNLVIVIEEAHRYRNYVKALLQECRKFCKILVISQISLSDVVPKVEVVEK